MVRDWLRKPFRPEQIGKLPATPKRPALDFVGHAAVTDRLNKIAPDWTYTIDNLAEINGKFWIRGTMTIGGVSRPEFGDGDDPKEAIGNFIRRAAMRFGVAIDLWSREELEASPAAGPPSGEAGERPSHTRSDGAATKPPTELAPAEGAGDPSAEGEAAGTGPGEGQTKPSPGPTISTTLDKCTHRGPSGRWLPTKVVDGQARCPRCGESAVKYRESA
jgi:hypothetical protein